MRTVWPRVLQPGRSPPAAVQRLLASAFVAVRHAAKVLACVTHAANNHEVVLTAADGHAATKVLRDASEPERPRAGPARPGFGYRCL